MNRRRFLFSALSVLATPFLWAQEKTTVSDRLTTGELREAKTIGATPAPKRIDPGGNKSIPRATIYPFDVRIGGQLAVIEGNPETAIFAKIKEPVSADAAIELEGTPGLLIVNVFPVFSNGEVPSNPPTKIMLTQSGLTVRLDQTMDKSVLTPGRYGANIVFGGMTSRVMFEVR